MECIMIIAIHVFVKVTTVRSITKIWWVTISKILLRGLL